MAINFDALPDIPTFDDQQAGPPHIWWFNGVRTARTPGTFYTNLNQLGTEPTDAWVSSTRFDSEDGFEANTLRLAILGWRQQAFRKVDERRVYLPAWEPGAQLHTEVLCFAEGIDKPVVWSAKGLTGKAITAKAGIVSTYRAGLLREAERKARRKLPLWMFWLPVSTQRDASGRIAYVSTGYANNTITPPALHLPSDSLDECMSELFVGNSMIEWGADVRAEFDTWLKQRRGADTDAQHEQAQDEEMARSSAHTDDAGQIPF